MRRLVVTCLYPNIGLPNPYTSHVADSPHDAAEALQHAALKAIDAMRGVLDAAEDLVADPGQLQDVVSGVGEWAEKLTATFGGAAAAEPEEGPTEDPDDDGRLRRIPLD